MKNNELNIPIEKDRLINYGENSAAQTKAEGSISGRRCAGRIAADVKRLEAMHAVTGSEWLLDNMYVIRSRAKRAAACFRGAGRLRRSGGEAVVLSAARALVRCLGGEVDAESISLFLDGYQRGGALTEKELSVFVPAAEAALLSYLADDEKRAEKVIKSLAAIASRDISPILEEKSVLEARLRRDPAGVYPEMDRESRAMYRRELAKLARRMGISEDEAGRIAVEKAASGTEGHHVGSYILARGRKRPYGAYIAANVLIPVFISILLAIALEAPAAFLLTVLPVGEAVSYIIDRVSVRAVKPRRLPRMDYSGGIPHKSRTLCVTAVLLTSPQAAGESAAMMEQYRLANRAAGRELIIGMLADLPESKSEHAPGDEETLARAAEETRRLNEKYGGGFCLLTRGRSFSKRDGIYRGRERKRGAVIELVSMLRGSESGLRLAEGSRDDLRDVKYLIILDADTRLTVESAALLAGTIAHPLHRPVVRGDRVVSGTGIIQPKISTDIDAASRSDFAAVFAGQGGLDPYGSVNSDVYQDVFGEASFCGKGIMSVDAAYACLTGRFPPETLLSHDLIEGSYLGCAYASDVELTDGFPGSLLSYFERRHRWIRGDWQTLPWLFGRVKNEKGERVKNPISPIAKWKIFDNLRRSLVPVSGFAALMLCALFGGRALLITAGTVLACLAVKVIVNSMRPFGERKKYRSAVVTGAGADLMQFLMLIILLPYSSFIALTASVTALFRMYVSHRNMLSWVTAAQSDKNSGTGTAKYYRRMASCPAAGAFIIAFTPYPPAMALAILWIFAPLIAMLASRERKSDRSPGEEDRLFLLHCAADIWRYFDRLLTAERNWLAPDNVSLEPQEKIAERTSPTNIGLSMLAAVSARDLGLCSEARCNELISHMLDTVEAMPKFRGHLYNWYDIRNLTPLKPEYVSTVDSGNLLCCLITLTQCTDSETAARARALADAMKMDFLYDRERRLFHIGWEPASDRPSGGSYDLLESEARMTSYAAVARGEAEPRHWRTLGRITTDCGGVSGLASWTGTMFEYFMPALLMPFYKNSLLGESLELCYTAQRRGAVRSAVRGGRRRSMRRGAGRGVWGISESSFAAFDASMNYGYKAHGVQSIALKRGMDREKVISPYSTFLALPMSPSACASNLRRLRSLGMEGEYGFYEAADFTDGFKAVKCFMAHHLAMSIIAVDNCLCAGAMRRRFMADAEMAAYSGLLAEKSPVGQPIPTDTAYRGTDRQRTVPAADTGGTVLTGMSLERPEFRQFSNGGYSLLINELGQSRASRGETMLYAYRPRRTGAHHGVLFFARWDDTGQLVPLQPAPEYFGDAEYSTQYLTGEMHLISRVPGLESSISSGVLPAWLCGEVRRVEVKNTGREKRTLSVAMYFEPALAAEDGYFSHPAFSKLCIEPHEKDGCIIFTRRGGGREGKISLAAACDSPYRCSTDKITLFGRGGLAAMPAAMARKTGHSVSASSEPCLFMRVTLTLRPGEKKHVKFVLCAADSSENAAAAALRALKKGEADDSGNAAAARKYDAVTAASLLSVLACRRPVKPEPWWQYGISGDYPVFAADTEGDTELKHARRLMSAYGYLSAVGFRFDLVFRLHDMGKYGRPEHTALSAMAAELGLSRAVGARGGIHFINGGGALPDGANAPVTDENVSRTVGRSGKLPFFLPPGADNRAVRDTFWDDDAFRFTAGSGIGTAAWSNVISNGRMGWLATDSFGGCMWLENAREKRLNRWVNDPLAIAGTERIELVRDGTGISLAADADGHECTVRFGFGWASWTKSIDGTKCTVTGFIPQDRQSRVLLVELENPRRGDGVGYFTQYERHFEISSNSVPLLTRKSELDRLTGGGVRGGEECFYAVYPAAETLVITAGEPVTSVDEAREMLEKTKRYWREITDRLKIKTPLPELDRYINGWALYQTLACRILGRCSLYQCGGAYGFRDQLQDVCALADLMPELARGHILRCARHQYAEGDVMHWWHHIDGEADRGVRTHCSDDLLWLPYAAAYYTAATGDEGILDEKVPWLISPALSDSEHDRYESPQSGGEDTLKEHCIRAIRLVLKRGTGAHGLLLIGTGDWNDGFDGFGSGGESVWLTWFAVMVMRRWEGFEADAERLAAAADAAFENGHYLRGYRGNGESVGAEGADGCAIDSIAQSFAVFSGASTHGREAVYKAVERLYDRESGLVKLFDPPFDGEGGPGYIRSYLPGVRENGGQYSHAAVWLACACIELGDSDTALELLTALLPSKRSEAVYLREPNVIAADVYSNPDMSGTGGWSWYTGAAGWYLRAVLHGLLGIKTEGGKIKVNPRLPSSWDGYDAMCGGHAIHVSRKDGQVRTAQDNP